MIKDVSIVREVRFEQVKMPIEVIIADAHAHTGLLHAVITQGGTPQHAFFAKSSISIVHE